MPSVHRRKPGARRPAPIFDRLEERALLTASTRRRTSPSSRSRPRSPRHAALGRLDAPDQHRPRRRGDSSRREASGRRPKQRRDDDGPRGRQEGPGHARGPGQARSRSRRPWRRWPTRTPTSGRWAAPTPVQPDPRGSHPHPGPDGLRRQPDPQQGPGGDDRHPRRLPRPDRRQRPLGLLDPVRPAPAGRRQRRPDVHDRLAAGDPGLARRSGHSNDVADGPGDDAGRRVGPRLRALRQHHPSGGELLLVQRRRGGGLLPGVHTAASTPGVVDVSVSYGGQEFAGETGQESLLQPVAGNPNAIAFSTGDGGFPSFPATSPSVLAVGGTGLYLASARGRYGYETAWGNIAGDRAGGGGVSTHYAAPTFQAATASASPAGRSPTSRPSPTLLTPVAVYDSYDAAYSGRVDRRSTGRASPRRSSPG